MHEFTTKRRIEFVDTDMGGIVHFSRFFIFMETAEHQLLESLGTSVHTKVEGKDVGWPRVAASCEYESPARFGDVLDIRVRIERKGNSSMTYGFTFTREGAPIAHGRMTAVCCVFEHGKGVRTVPIPAALRDRLEEAPKEG